MVACLLLKQVTFWAVGADRLAFARRMRNDLMMLGPNKKTNKSAVIKAPPVRNVM
jgi:hypothetical protein